METCVACGRELWRGHCLNGHSQLTEPSTIDEALEQRSQTLGAIFGKAKQDGLLPPIDQTSWSVTTS